MGPSLVVQAKQNSFSQYQATLHPPQKVLCLLMRSQCLHAQTPWGTPQRTGHWHSSQQGVRQRVPGRAVVESPPELIPPQNKIGTGNEMHPCWVRSISQSRASTGKRTPGTRRKVARGPQYPALRSIPPTRRDSTHWTVCKLAIHSGAPLGQIRSNSNLPPPRIL